MCGRFAFYSPAEAAAALFGVETDRAFAPRFNVAPTQDVAAIRSVEGEGEELVPLRWGLVPFWAKDPSIGNRMINARAETVAEKPAYRNAYRKRRCLILADGFYEWRKESDGKTPWFIARSGGEPLALAGLWEDWTDRETGESLQTATIVTTAANDFMKALHARMPVIVVPDTARGWLDEPEDFLADYDARCPALEAWPVSRRVNNPRNEGEDLIERRGDSISADA